MSHLRGIGLEQYKRVNDLLKVRCTGKVGSWRHHHAVLGGRHLHEVGVHPNQAWPESMTPSAPWATAPTVPLMLTLQPPRAALVRTHTVVAASPAAQAPPTTAAPPTTQAASAVQSPSSPWLQVDVGEDGSAFFMEELSTGFLPPDISPSWVPRTPDYVGSPTPPSVDRQPPTTCDVAVQVDYRLDHRDRVRRRLHEDNTFVGHLRPVPEPNPGRDATHRDNTTRVDLREQRRMCGCERCVRHATRLAAEAYFLTCCLFIQKLT